MATVCYTQATLTSARVSTIFGEGATLENHVYTSAAYYITVPRAGLCPYVLGAQDCNNFPNLSLVPARVYTVPITLHYQRTTYVTNFVTLYSTSCSVSQRPSPSPTPTPTTTTPTKSISVGSTTTQNSPSQTLSTVTGSSDTGVHNLGAGGKGTAVTRKVPVGAIVGGVLGGLVAAALLGILVFKLCIKTTKGQDQGHKEHLRRRRRRSSQSAVDELSSPSEGSPGAPHSQGALQPQMQEYGAPYANEYGATYANAYGGQGSYNIAAAPGHQYTHVRQDSMAGVGAAMGGVHFSPSSPVLGPEQGYYRQSGHYLGHAEIQDSTI